MEPTDRPAGEPAGEAAGEAAGQEEGGGAEPASPDIETASDDAAAPGSPPGQARGPVVVGIGASAGGLAALKQLFGHVPERTGLAFVVVVHLSPAHESHLADILQPHVAMPVVQVTEMVPIEPDHVYLIPPGRNLETVDTHLHLSKQDEHRPLARTPIDFFFRTLARSHDGRAIGVILSGAGSDGTLGLKDIKEQGGLTIVQAPGEAAFDGMPQSAISTGLIDLVLPLSEIPAALLRFTRTKPRLPVPEGDGDVEGQERQLLQKIFAQVRARTGRDFSRYKRSTIMRRIERRMQLHHVEQLSAYLDLLREHPEEVRALSDEFLIPVTTFFRDASVFERLEQQVVPRLFDAKPAGGHLRLWSVGCATGEEAYSLAILLLEEAARHEGAPPRLHVFATDLHERSLEKAREGLYTEDIEADVSPERLRRFFTRESGGYRIRKEVRELVVFAPHNLLGDPPFSKMDLIVCRNVLIYLDRNVQREVAELFHYALNPNGSLLLGTSETADRSDLFAVEDKKVCLYRKLNVPAPAPHLPVFPSIRSRLRSEGESVAPAEAPVSYAALQRRMLEQYGPPSLLLNQEHRVVHLSGQGGRYLRLPGGEPTSSVFRLVREELRVELRAALHAASGSMQPVRSKPVSLVVEGAPRLVVLHVEPAREREHHGLFLVIFEEREAPGGPAAAAGVPATPTTEELEAELRLTKQELQAIIEEHETGQEEMKAAMEELQSANEELRSTMEELETSQEELQSTNEELQTINQENRHKVEELAQLSGDLQNLLANTGIATLFLDRTLRILRFTPGVAELFNVRIADRGRPLSDLTHRLGYEDLLGDARRVLEHLVPVEREVRDEASQWYLTRVLPYQVSDGYTEGVVITFVDITARKQAEEALRASEERHRLIVESARDYAIFTLDAAGRIERWWPGAESVFGWRAEEAAGRDVAMTFTPEDRAKGEPEQELATAREQGWAPNVRWHVRKDGGTVFIEGWVQALYDAQGALSGFLKIGQDVTERRRVEEALRASEGRFRAVANLVPDLLWEGDAAGARTWGNQRWMEYTGQTLEEAVGGGWAEAIHRDDREAALQAYRAAIEAGAPFRHEHRLRRADGAYRWFLVEAVPVRDDGGRITRWFGSSADVHEQRTARETLEERVEERTHQVRELARRLALAEQEERQRIAQILHDDLQQILFGVRMKLGVLQQRLRGASPGMPLEEIEKAEAWTGEAIALTRRLTVDLNPPLLAGENLADALHWLASQMQEVHRLQVEVEDGLPADRTLEPEMAMLLFQITRELLFNVVKHAATGQVRVELGEAEGDFVLRVVDEGRGMEPAPAGARQEGFGLRHIAERLRLFGGSLEVASTPGAGTRVAVRLPATFWTQHRGGRDG